jgi:hypothetical protein
MFPLTSVSRPTLGPTQPPVQWVLGILSPALKFGRGVTLTTHLHLVPRSRKSRSYTSSPHKHLRGVQWDSFTFYNMGSHNVVRETHAAHSRHWCCSRKIPLIMLGFKNKIFYLIFLHKYKLFLPLCLKSSIFIFVFTFFLYHGDTQKHL